MRTRRITPIAFNLPSGTQHFFALDGQGTADALIQSDGTVSGTYTYTPYGDLQSATGTGDAYGANVIRHTLGLTDSTPGATGWTKHGVRWNDNTTGTWTTQDTLSFVLDPNNANRYNYSGSDPINNADPSGESFLGCLGSSIVAGGSFLALGGEVFGGPETGGASWLGVSTTGSIAVGSSIGVLDQCF